MVLRHVLRRRSPVEPPVPLPRPSEATFGLQRIVIQLPVSDRARPTQPAFPYQPGSIESITNSFCGG